MTDRELLDLAAKAIGLKFHQNGDGLAGYVAASNGDWRCGWVYWNPLIDDGAALRLLVKLRLDLNIGKDGALVGNIYHDSWDSYEPYSGDEELSVRRAIVCAAAEIGKAMT